MRQVPHPFTLRQLQYVAAVAETLSFRRAAERCRVSQPSLSAQLAQLEAAIGVRLFERDRRRVLLTPAGNDLVKRARHLLVEADDLLQAAKRAEDLLKGALRIGILPTISPYLLPHATPLLRKSFPELTIGWMEEKTPVLMTSLRDGDLEAALLALEADIGDVESEIIAKDPFALVAPPDHPLMRKTSPVSPIELRGVGVLLLDEGHCFRKQALEWCSRARAHELELRATSLSTLVQMAASGAGITLLPALAVPAETKRARLRVRPFAPPAPHRTLALVWRRGSPLDAALRRVAGVFREAYRRVSK
jgi:LysR family hydrogen peroxide-inducible transcriptional activator